MEILPTIDDISVLVIPVVARQAIGSDRKSISLQEWDVVANKTSPIPLVWLGLCMGGHRLATGAHLSADTSYIFHLRLPA